MPPPLLKEGFHLSKMAEKIRKQQERRIETLRRR